MLCYSCYSILTKNSLPYLNVELATVVLGLVRVTLGRRLNLSLGETLERFGVCCNGMGDELGVHLPRGVIHIGQIIPDLVVVLIIPDTGFTAKHLYLVLCRNDPIQAAQTQIIPIQLQDGNCNPRTLPHDMPSAVRPSSSTK